MKYLYFFCILAYVSAEDMMNLQSGTPLYCQCNDTLNQLINLIKQTDNEAVNIEKTLIRIKKDIKDVKVAVDLNCEKITDIDNEVNVLEKLVNTNLNSVNYQKFILIDIDAKLKALEQEGDALDCLLDDNTEVLDDIKCALEDTKECYCNPPTTTAGEPRTTPTTFHYDHY